MTRRSAFVPKDFSGFFSWSGKRHCISDDTVFLVRAYCLHPIEVLILELMCFFFSNLPNFDAEYKMLSSEGLFQGTTEDG